MSQGILPGLFSADLYRSQANLPGLFSTERDSTIQLARTQTPNRPPDVNFLKDGELFIEQNDPVRVWVGVPTAMDSRGHRLVFDRSVLSTTWIQATPPAEPPPGALWWCPEDGNLYAWYDDGTSVQWVPATSVISSGDTQAVTSFNNRAGDVVLLSTDITLVGGALLNSPALIGTPTAPTVTPTTDSTTKIATTAFVRAAVGSVPGGAVISDTPPTLAPGGLWWASAEGQLYVRFDDGTGPAQFVAATNISGLADAATKSEVTAVSAAAQRNVGRNYVHNSVFTVTQRGTAIFNATPFGSVVYSADRWAGYAGASGDSLTMQVLPHSDGSRVSINDEDAVQFMSCVFTGGSGAANGIEFLQRIENARRFANKVVTLSFWANASSNMPLGLNLTQSYGTTGGSPAFIGVPKTVNLTATLARYSVTFNMPSLAGKTFGTPAGSDFTQLEFWFSSGANLASRAGVGPQSGTINLWGVQLEIGTVATPLEKLDTMLALQQCQRFAVSMNALLCSTGYALAGTIFYMDITHPVTLRAAPITVSYIFSNVTYSNASTAALNIGYPAHSRFSTTATAAGAAYSVFDVFISVDL